MLVDPIASIKSSKRYKDGREYAFHDHNTLFELGIMP